MNYEQQNHNHLLQETLSKIKAEPKFIAKTYSQYNAGYIGDGSFGYLRPKDLEISTQEAAVIELGRKALEVCGQFNLVGVGEMVGFGLTKVAAAFEAEILAGKAQVVVTNFENSFLIEPAIAEARRRLKIFGSVANYRLMRNLAKPASPDMTLLGENKPILQSAAEIDFLDAYHHLVQYVSGVDVHDLRKALDQVSPDFRANVVHENMGGFTHCYNRQQVLGVMPHVLSPVFGFVVTTTNIDSGDYLVGREEMTNQGFVKRQHALNGLGYKVYSNYQTK